MNLQRIFLLAVVVSLLFNGGCNKGQPTEDRQTKNADREQAAGTDDGVRREKEKQEEADLRLLALGYDIFINNEHVPPQSPDDIRRVTVTDRPIDFKKFVVIWAVDLAKIAARNSTVIAYAVDVPKDGGMVAFADRSVRRVSAEEFRSLTKATPVAKTVERKSDFTLSAADFIAECNKDKMAAKGKYEDRIVELKGIIKGFDATVPPIIGTSGTELRLCAPGSDGFYSIRCFLTESQPWGRLAKGQQVTVKGIAVDPTYGGPGLKKASVLAAGPGDAVVCSAKDIAAEFEKDPEGTIKKNYGKSTIVTGEIAGREDKGNGWLTLHLKGTNKTELICDFRRLDDGESKPLIKGARVKLYGEFEATSDKVVLDYCLLIKD
jgi:tRNA_anti-like